MTTTSAVKMKNIKKRTSSGISIFIDLLGFGRKILDATSYKDISKLADSLDIVRDAFDYKKKGAPSSTEEKRYALSDSVITFIPLKSEAMKYTNSFDVLLNEITTLAYDQMICIEHGIFIRGGVSYGWFYEDGDNFISDALTQAAALEKEIWAPVIGISDHTINYFKEHNARNFYSEDSDPLNRKTFLKMRRNMKTFYYLNYLKIAIEAVSPKVNEEFRALLRSDDQNKINEAYWHAQAEALLLHKQQILKAVKKIKDKEIRKKYQWLVNYHNKFSKPYIKVNPAVMIENIV